MTAALRDAWEARTLDAYLDVPEYDYTLYKGLPYVFCPRLNRWRDAVTGEFVSELTATVDNDAECERQDENARDAEEAYWREEF